MADQGIVSFSFDPNSGNYISDSWCADLQALVPAGQSSSLRVRTPVISAGADNSLPVAGYRAALDIYRNHGISVGAVLPPEFDRADHIGACPNDPLGADGDPLLNTYIDHYARRAAEVASPLAPHGLTTYWVWNEPNMNGRLAQGENCPPGAQGVHPTSLSPANFAALLYQSCTRLRASGATQIYAGALSMLYPSSPQNSSVFDLYMDAVYRYLNQQGIRAPYPWDALSLDMEGLWPRSSGYAGQVFQALRSVQRSYGDESPIIVSEWGTKWRYADQQQPNAQETYDDLRSTFAAMYFFEHGTNAEGYGATEWGVSGGQFVPTAMKTAWYARLQALFGADES